MILFQSCQIGCFIVVVFSRCNVLFVALLPVLGLHVGRLAGVIGIVERLCYFSTSSDKVIRNNHINPFLVQCPVNQSVIGGNEGNANVRILFTQCLRLFPLCTDKIVFKDLTASLKAKGRYVDIHTGRSEDINEVDIFRIAQHFQTTDRSIRNHLHIFQNERRMEVGEGIHSQTVMAVQLIDSVLLPVQNVTVISNIVNSLLRPRSTLGILHGIDNLRLQFCTELRVDVTHQLIDVCQMACINHRFAVLVGIHPHLETAVHRIGVFSAVKELLVQFTASGDISIGIVLHFLQHSISLGYILTQECTIGFSVSCYIAVSTFWSQTSAL